MYVVTMMVGLSVCWWAVHRWGNGKARKAARLRRLRSVRARGQGPRAAEAWMAAAQSRVGR